MRLLASHPRSLFVGQNVRYSGTNMYRDLEGVPDSQRVEHPICEDFTVGYATGLALMGYLPIVVIPRMDFLLRAADQIVSHLDKIPAMSCGQWNPKIIIRTRVGSKKPLDAGPQHTNDLTDAFRLMLSNVDVLRIYDAADILKVYSWALGSVRSSIIVEAIGC